MDETGMSDADKMEFVDDVLRTWGEEAAREVAERFEVDLDALKREPDGLECRERVNMSGFCSTLDVRF